MCGLRSQCLIVTAFTIDGLFDWYMICMKHLQTIHVWFKYQTIWGLYNHYQSWQSHHKATIWTDSWNTTHKNGLLLGMVDPMALLALVAKKSEDYGWLIFELLHVTFDFSQFSSTSSKWWNMRIYTSWVADPFQKVSEFCSWVQPKNSPSWSPESTESTANVLHSSSTSPDKGGGFFGWQSPVTTACDPEGERWCPPMLAM